jgi:hypothetical protein
MYLENDNRWKQYFRRNEENWRGNGAALSSWVAIKVHPFLCFIHTIQKIPVIFGEAWGLGSILPHPTPKQSRSSKTARCTLTSEYQTIMQTTQLTSRSKCNRVRMMTESRARHYSVGLFDKDAQVLIALSCTVCSVSNKFTCISVLVCICALSFAVNETEFRFMVDR